MHKNYFLFERLLKEIKPQILGRTIAQPFTYQKDEVVLPLQNDTFLRVSVSADHPYVLLLPQKNIRQPSLEIFPEIAGRIVLDLRLKPFDKHVILELEGGYFLEALFYAPYFNVFLFDSQRRLINTFKDKNTYPTEVSSPEMPGLVISALETDVLGTLLAQNKAETLDTFFKKHFVALNNVLLNEIFFRLQLHKTQTIERLSSADLERVVKTLKQLSTEINSSGAYLYYRNERIERIAILPLRHLEALPEIRFKTSDSLNRALSLFYQELTFKQEILKLRTLCSQALQKRLHYLQNSLQKLQQNADLESRKAEAELKGNLLLTFKTSIPKGAKEVELENIFSDRHEKIKIKLNPAKSAVENAQKYFNKFKRLNEEKRLHEIRRNTYQKEWAEINALKEQLEKINDLTRLKKFAQKLKEMKILPRQADENAHTIPAPYLKYAFRRLILDKKWDVYIGKDGPNNELLTFRFAHKWDIWLHAQGVPGSHVIIHLPGRNSVPPKHVIEQAAQLAAAHSKAKHSSTVSVMYTQVRYVSRMRKAPPGTVKVQKEKVLFVKPLEIK